MFISRLFPHTPTAATMLNVKSAYSKIIFALDSPLATPISPPKNVTISSPKQ